MPNEKVSQMVSLTAAELAADDIFLVGDISARESKKMTTSELVSYVQTSGSFVATSAGVANTASYVLGSNVDGAVDSASYSDVSVSSSYALRASNAGSSSFAATASYVGTVVTSVATASFLQYSGGSNGTASYAVASATSVLATSASALLYSGTPNGTASFALSSSWAITASFVQSSSVSISSSYAKSSSVADSSSYATKALTADTVTNVPFPTFITPVTVYNGTAAVGPVSFDASSYVGDSATVAILDCSVFNTTIGGGSGLGYVYIRKNASSPNYVLSAYAGVSELNGRGSQGFFPMDTKTFEYTVTDPADYGVVIRLIGYM